MLRRSDRPLSLFWSNSGKPPQTDFDLVGDSFVQGKSIQFFCFHKGRWVDISGEKEVWSWQISLIVKQSRDHFLEPCVVLWFFKSFVVTWPCNVATVATNEHAWEA